MPAGLREPAGKNRKSERDWKAEAVAQWNADPCGADREAAFGSAEFFERVERERYDRYAPWMREAIGFDRARGKRLLEVGFGLGTDHVSFARAGADCFGIDLTPAHVEATRRRLGLESYPARLIRGDAESLPYESKNFDLVYSFGVLHHTPGTQAAIDEIHRVLKPGGEAIIGLYHRNSAFYWYNTVFLRGILLGGFFRDGYWKTLSAIEARTGSDAVPLVKVYSRRDARRLLSKFDDVRVDVRHFEFDHAGRVGSILKKLFGPGKFWDRFGWYVIVRGRRPAVAA